MDDSITANITPNVRIKANVSIDPRDTKIIAKNAVNGDLSGSTSTVTDITADVTVDPRDTKIVARTATIADCDCDTELDIISDVDLGGIEKQQNVNAGTSLQEFAELLLLKTYYPSYVNPSASLSVSGLSSNTEVGSVGFTLNAGFNRGQIKGDNVDGVWDANVKQNDRAGPANLYTFSGATIDVTPQVSSSLILSNTTIVEGNNNFSVYVDYDEGPQPLDSKDDVYETPLSAGSTNRSLIIKGKRKAFFGIDAEPLNSDDVRALSNSLLGPTSGSTFSIDIVPGTSKVAFAYPASLGEVTKVESVAAFGADVKSAFSLQTFEVEGANAYSSVIYNVYTFIPLISFSQTDEYIVTI